MVWFYLLQVSSLLLWEECIISPLPSSTQFHLLPSSQPRHPWWKTGSSWWLPRITPQVLILRTRLETLPPSSWRKEIRCTCSFGKIAESIPTETSVTPSVVICSSQCQSHFRKCWWIRYIGLQWAEGQKGKSKLLMKSVDWFQIQMSNALGIPPVKH